MNLTEQQKRAAHAAGSVVITAGAGTGKTAMLAERFLHHVTADRLRPIEIVAVTFTEKAAAELRQRIRKRLTEGIDDEDLIAEVDAAQISTIHALAARVCREFYHLVGMPPDFRILLETESEIWLADKFDAAMAEVDESIIAELGYEWLKGAVRQLLFDPNSSAKALGKGADTWKLLIDEARDRSIRWLQECEAWIEAEIVCGKFSGKSGDKLEDARRDAINAMRDLATGDNVAAAIKTLRKLPAHQGQKGFWGNGGLDEMRSALKRLKKAAAEDGPAGAATLVFGPEDAIAAHKVQLLEKAFVAVWTHLEAHKKRDKVMDFVDLEIFARRILEHKQAQNYYARRWRAFLVDEFQDTNPLQAEIIDLLTSNAKLTIVGDEKQSIYGFRRADIEVFRRVRENILASGGDAIELSQTFRSHKSLALMTNDTFAPVLGSLHQPLHSARTENPNREIPLTLAMIPDDVKAGPDAMRVAESRFIADEIKRLVNSSVMVYDKGTGGVRRVAYRDIAILSRTWAAVDIYIDALSASGIPAVNAGGGKLLDTREAKDAVAILSFLADTTDDISLAAVLRGPFFAISDRVLYDLARSKQKGQSWWSLLQMAGGEVAAACSVLTDLLQAINSISPEDILREADKRTGYTATIANLPQGDRREADWLGMLSLIRQMGINGLSDLYGAVKQLKALALGRNSIPRPPLDAGNAVCLTSIHNAKGLEWPIVFVPDLSTKISGWGDKLLVESDIGVAFEVEDDVVKAKPAIYELIKQKIKVRECEEEKRLLYVAVTRARDRVILTSGPMKGGTAIEFLMPGVKAAGMVIGEIPFSEELTVPPTPVEAPAFKLPGFRYPGPVGSGLKILPVTGLTEYSICPLKFRYVYLDGHPGLGEGEARSRTIGTLTHRALQFDIKTIEELERVAEGASAQYAKEALLLADTFRQNDVFRPFRNDLLEKEKGFSLQYSGVSLHGSADLVGEDFVLDYKTGETQVPDVYRLQLWAYAYALGKPRAVVAFLRSPKAYEFPTAVLEASGREAARLIEKIAAGKFPADPAPSKCAKCAYSKICKSSAAAAIHEPFVTKTAEQQLELFS